MKWLTNTIKKYHPETHTVVGNSVGGSCYEVFMKNCKADVVVIGEGELTTLDVLNAAKNKSSFEQIEGIVYRNNKNEIIKNPPRKGEPNIDKFPIIKWHKYFDVKRYLKGSSGLSNGVSDLSSIIAFPLSTARGCAFRCSFCHFVYWDDIYRAKSPARIIEEIKYLVDKYNANFFAFWDDLSFAGLTQVERLCDAILESGIKIKWSAAIRSDLLGNAKKSYERRLKVAEKMKASGCTTVGYALESGDAEILKMMNKKVKPEYYSEQIKILKKAGVPSATSVVFGYPIETKETIRKTFEMCSENGTYPSIGFLLPFPYTGMYAYAKEHGYITDEDEYLDSITERQDHILNMTEMSDEEIKTEINLGASKLNDELNLGLKDFIKTGTDEGHNKYLGESKLKDKTKIKRNINDVSLDYSDLEFDEDMVAC